MKSSPIFVRVGELIQAVYKETAHYPKRVRGSLTVATEMDSLHIDECLRAAVKLPEEKFGRLREADLHLDRLKGKIANARELEFLSFAGYERLSKITSEVGRLLGGWMRKESQ